MNTTENKKSTLSGNKKILVPTTEKKLIITEKPSVAQQFATALNVKRTEKTNGYIEDDNYVITWCIGHLVGMLYPEAYDEKYKKWRLEDLPFLPGEYKYGVISAVKEQYKIVNKLLHRKDIDVCYWAGDSGREGQVIEENIRRYGGVRAGMKELRVWIDSQTDEAIKKGIREAKPMSAYDNMADSGVMRSIEDYAMGINFSRALSIKYAPLLNSAAGLTKYTPISVGRVMTCVLGMIVDRERLIRNFKEENFYKVIGKFGSGVFAEWKLADGSIYSNDTLKLFKDIGFKDVNDAKNLINKLQGQKGIINEIEIKDSKKAAPLLFNLAELQNVCSKKFKISPSETLEVAQALYEKKLTTYPRTDARVLSTSVAVEIEKNLKGLHKSYSDTQEFTDKIIENGLYRNIDKSKYTDDKRITDHYAIIPTGDMSELTTLTKLQRDVFDLIVRRFLRIFYPAAIYNSVKLSLNVGTELFVTSSKCLANLGYLAVTSDSDEDDGVGDNKLAEFVKSMKKGDIISLNDMDIKEGKTTPPKRYSSGSIILAMENAGQLIEDEELRSQIKGSGIGTSATRAEIIKKLISNQYIKCNKSTQILSPCEFGEMVYEVVNSTVPEMLNPELSAIWDKELEDILNGDISFTSYKIKLDNYIRENTLKIISADKIDEIKRCLSPKSASNSSAESIKCPYCGGNVVKTSFGYGCSNYQSGCKFNISNRIKEKAISESVVKQLCSKGFTSVIKGFVSQKGTKFDAKLKINKEAKKIEFVFVNNK